jgi:hypothetical protein
MLSLILELVTNLDDARLYLQHSHSEIGHSAIGPKNNLTIDDVTHAIQSNNAIDYTERLRTSLNDKVRASQGLSLENKLLEFNSRFNVASDIVRSRMLQEVDRGMDILTQEEQNIARIQDPAQIKGQRGRTFGKGGPRKRTAAEIAEKELKRNDRRRPPRTKQSSQSEPRIIDITSSFTTSQQRFGVEMSSSTLPISMPQDPNITNPDEIQVLPSPPNTHSNTHSNQSPSQTRRHVKRSAHFQPEIKVVQPNKRVRKEKRG